MLEKWKKYVPLSFAAHSSAFTELTAEQEESIDELLTHIFEAGLLSEETFKALVEQSSSQLKELYYLIKTLVQYSCLNQKNLNALFACDNIEALQSSIVVMDQAASLSGKTITFLFSVKDPSNCAQLIKRAAKAGVQFEAINELLLKHIEIDGLKDAMKLFDHSQATYTKAHFKRFGLLTAILANPLCRIIFDARLRCFSDYSESSDPLEHANVADTIISQLQPLANLDENIRIFFNFFAKFRPFPPSQKYIVDIDVAERVVMALNSYCSSRIAAIVTKDDYLAVAQLIGRIKAYGGNNGIFNAIKYEVVSSIEEEDMCSTQDYDGHMKAIIDVLNKPQESLADFTEQLQKSKGYQLMQTAQMQRHALLMQSALSAAPKANQKDEVVAMQMSPE